MFDFEFEECAKEINGIKKSILINGHAQIIK